MPLISSQMNDPEEKLLPNGTEIWIVLDYHFGTTAIPGVITEHRVHTGDHPPFYSYTALFTEPDGCKFPSSMQINPALTKEEALRHHQALHDILARA